MELKTDPRLISGWGSNAQVLREGLSEEIAINGLKKRWKKKLATVITRVPRR